MQRVGDDSKIDSDFVNQRDLREIVYIIFLVGLLLFSWIQYLLIHNLGSHSHRRKNNPFLFLTSFVFVFKRKFLFFLMKENKKEKGKFFVIIFINYSR